MTSSPHFNEAQATEYLGVAPKTLSGGRWTGVRYSIADFQDFAAIAAVTL